MKTSELIGAALDWAVANAEGRIWAVWRFKEQNDEGDLQYGSDWSLAGPIIERELIELTVNSDARSNDAMWMAKSPDWFKPGYGPSPLVAAMRCFVVSRLGDDVEIPEELKE